MAKNILGAMLFSLIVAPLGAQMNRARPTTAPEGTDVEQFRESWRAPGRRRFHLTPFSSTCHTEIDIRRTANPQ